MSKEKRFLEIIRGVNNRKGEMTYNEVVSLLRSDNNFSSNGFLAKHRKSGSQIIKENFPEIIDRTISIRVATLLNLLMQRSDFDETITKNLDCIVRKLNEDSITRRYIAEFYKKFMQKSPQNSKFIEENITSIIQSAGIESLFETALALKGISPRTDDILNKELENHNVEVAKSLIEDYTYALEYYRGVDIDIDGYAETLALIMKELLESENKRSIDFNKIGVGAYSAVFSIGDRILKVGKPRRTYDIPNSKRILQPMLRTNFKRNNGQIFAAIEVSNSVDTNLSLEEKSTETLYALYKELREEGIIWGDVKWQNVGRLKSRNVPVLHGEEYDVSPNAVGFDKELVGEPLEAGELVVIDTDYIAREGIQDKRFFIGDSYKYEERYINEIMQEFSKKKEKNKNEQKEPFIRDDDEDIEH